MNLSYAHGISDAPLIGRTIGDYFDDVVLEFSDNEALVSTFENRRFTYSALRAAVDRVARSLIALDVKKGERVGIWSTNCVAWVLVQLATAKIGAILVTINPAYRLKELEFALKQSECSLLISGTRFKDADYVAMLHQIIPELAEADPRQDLKSHELPHLRRLLLLEESAHENILGWSELLSRADAVGAEELAKRQASLDFDDIINIQYTSGTTGFPKGAALTHRNILNNGFWVGKRMRFTHRDRLCIPVPFYHCFGMVVANLACIAHGATMVLPAPHFSPGQTLEAIAMERCTALHGVPTMFIAELEHPRFREFDLSSLRTGVMAGAPCPMEVMKRVMHEMHCPEMTIACGMTEASPICNMTEVDDPIELRVGSVGKVMPHQEQKIVDPASGQILLRGEQGELCYRGYQVMRCYYNNPQGTREMLDSAGWLHSGDVAVMDEGGYVRITGRLKDMICRGGEKIFPREVEEFLFTHPKISEAAVIGVPDSYYGEQVMAWIKVKPGETMTAEEVRTFCCGRIMDYKIPHHTKFVDDFPKTVTGKIQKYRMREISALELGLIEPQAKQPSGRRQCGDLFDADLDRELTHGSVPFEGQYVFTANGASRDTEAGNPTFGADADWFAATSKTDHGYQIEFKVKKSTLLNPADGATLGFHIAQNDDDGSGRRAQLGWSGRAHSEFTYGQLKLLGPTAGGQLKVNSITVKGNQLELSIATSSCTGTFTVQKTPQVAPATWSDLAGVALGPCQGGTITASFPIPSNSPEFYRVSLK